MASLQPRKPYTEDELRKLYPPGLELQLVQILLRHGERTPVSARFQNAGLAPFWPYCKSVRQLKSAILEGQGAASGGASTFSTFEWKRRLETFGPRDEPLIATGPGGELDAVCDMGSLTDLGRVTTLQLGARLRSLYVDRLRFIPSTITSTDFLYLRSTPIPRALESMQQTFTGLYPDETRESTKGAPFPAPTVILRTPSDETLFPNDGNCRRFAAFSRAFAQRTADRWNHTAEMAYLTKIYGKWMEGGNVAVDSRPRLSGIQDTVNATLAHGPATRLPADFYDAKARGTMERISVEEWFQGYKESSEYRRLGIGGLMGDIVARMVGSTEKTMADGEYELVTKTGQKHTTPLRFGLSGCHDTTLAAVLSSLGAFGPDKWPPFTSHIAVEMFRATDIAPAEKAGAQMVTATSEPPTKAGWFSSFFSSSAKVAAGSPPPGHRPKAHRRVVASREGQIRWLFCKTAVQRRAGDDSWLQTAWKPPRGRRVFLHVESLQVDCDKFTPANWVEECSANPKAPAFPVKPEPAGW